MSVQDLANECDGIRRSEGKTSRKEFTSRTGTHVTVSAWCQSLSNFVRDLARETYENGIVIFEVQQALDRLG